jgi:solute carrier family 8 (sodium/calcium exchanger)
MKDAVKLGPCIDEDNLIIDEVTLGEGLFHFACIGWKVIFALVPPVDMGGGIPAFAVALSFIGIVTMLVGEVATVLGCAIGLKASVTAITLVAMGTSLPDTLASMTAAKQFEFADSAIGNVTGSNCVNVFLGLGLPWVISAHYNESKGGQYIVPAGDLAFSVVLFLGTSVCCFILLVIRRRVIGGELGGPKTSAYASAFFLISLWVLYILFSSLKAYSII